MVHEFAVCAFRVNHAGFTGRRGVLSRPDDFGSD